MSTSTKILSASYVAVRFSITEKTARLFILKIREAMESSGNNPMTGIVYMDEFVLGRREKNKVGEVIMLRKRKL